jgi:hypothetical protein
MPDFRLRTDDGDVVETANHADDRDAVAWRSSHPFTSPSPEAGRQLRLEKLVDGHWIEIGPLGTAEID